MSFEIEVNEFEEAGGRLVAEFGEQLQEVFVYRRENDGMTQQEIADRLCVDRSRVNRCLSGFNNLTIGSLGELAHAMESVVIHRVVPKEQVGEWKLIRVLPTSTQGKTIIGLFDSKPSIRDTYSSDSTVETSGASSVTEAKTSQVNPVIRWASN
ncbi:MULTISPECIES: helix-turn-helix domain-containing protein [unclassified Agrobacterium]